MANWIMHTIIADRLLARGLRVDAHHFCIGCIAPDCNVENEDWTEFTPSRETTHWMSGKKKTTADYEAFFTEYITGETDERRRSFMLGYYAHLVADVRFAVFLHDETQMQNIYRRLNSEELDLVGELPQTFATLKMVIGKSRLMRDIEAFEAHYVLEHPECSYERLLRTTTTFPDYLPFLPAGAVVRKINVMAHAVKREVEGAERRFFTAEEIETYVENTVNWLLERIKKQSR